MKLGIIGTGRIAARFAELAEKRSEIELCCVCNPHLDSAQTFAQKYHIGTVTFDPEVVAKSCDAVYIASPHGTHEGYIRQMLLAGKHVLCEKPMVLSKKAAEELYALAAEKDCILMEGVKTSYCPGFEKMMEVAKSGTIGSIADVEASFTRLTPSNQREHLDPVGGSFTEFGSYTLLPILRLYGTDYSDMEVKAVYGANGADTYTKVFFSYPHGQAMSKTGLAVKSEGQLLITGSMGYILAESPWWMTQKFVIGREESSKNETVYCSYDGNGLSYELQEFIDRIGGAAPKKGITEKESIAMAQIMEKFLMQRPARREKSEVKYWAHRGCCMKQPENTLEAFEEAAQIPGLTGIETDVQLSKDGEVVVFHDEHTGRVSDGTKKIMEYTLAELKQLHIQAGNGETTTIPTLREMLSLLQPYCIKNGLLINIELKTSIVRYPGIEEKVLAIVHEYALEPYIVYSSFLADSIKIIKELQPQAQTGMLAETMELCIKGAEYAHADALHPWIGGMNAQPEGRLKDAPVRGWNCEEPFFHDGRVLKEFDMGKYSAFGITDIITNVPELYLMK